MANKLPKASKKTNKISIVKQDQSYRNLYIAAILSNLVTFSAGTTITWRMNISSDDVDSSKSDKINWFNSLHGICATIGPAIVYALIDNVGRKPLLYLSAFAIVVSWYLIVFSLETSQIHYPVIYLGRIISGLAVGITFTCIPIYITEIAEARVRESVGSLMGIFALSGYLLSRVISDFVSPFTYIMIVTVAPGSFLLFGLFLPESPYYLLMKMEKESAFQELMWLRRSDDNNTLVKEFNEMQMSVTESENNYGSYSAGGYIKSLYLSCGLIVFQQINGIHLIIFCDEKVSSLTLNDITPYQGNLIIVFSMMFFTGLIPVLVRFIDIKFLLIFSGGSLAIWEVLLGIWYFVNDRDYNNFPSDQDLPFPTVVIYIATYCIGFGFLPFVVLGEAFPLQLKVKGCTIAVTLLWVLYIVLPRAFSVFTTSHGMIFWVLACISIASVVFTIFLLPRTKGLSLIQIHYALDHTTYNRQSTSDSISIPSTSSGVSS